MKRRINTITLSCFVVSLIMGQTSPTFASSYYLIDSTTYYDANKTSANTDDDLMCWAAAASNVLTATGWGNIYSTSADDIFSYFQKYWTDAGGSPVIGSYWWFSGINPYQGKQSSDLGWAQLDQRGGGGYYKGYDFENYYQYATVTGNAMSEIEQLIESDYAVTLGLLGPTKHAVTVWGYETDTSGNYAGIYITDSDDGVSALRYYTVLQSTSDSKWYLQDYYGYDSYYIYDVFGLLMTTSSANAVPVPGTAVLLGSGLLALTAVRRQTGRRSFRTV